MATGLVATTLGHGPDRAGLATARFALAQRISRVLIFSLEASIARPHFCPLQRWLFNRVTRVVSSHR